MGAAGGGEETALDESDNDTRLAMPESDPTLRFDPLRSRLLLLTVLFMVCFWLRLPTTSLDDALERVGGSGILSGSLCHP